MTTSNDKKLTREEFDELMRLLNKAENENIEILEGLESLIRWTIIGKKLRHEDQKKSQTALFFKPLHFSALKQ